MGSIPERSQNVQRADVVIVGGGIIGLSTAYHLLLKQPGLRVVVLEREEMTGTGATSGSGAGSGSGTSSGGGTGTK